MRQLIVKDFSCIKNASVQFNKVTLFIGPQASGKSVICKLSYFFIDIINHQNEFIVPGVNLLAFKELVSKKFSEWFPPSAWGDKKFYIEFIAGRYSITVTRVAYRQKVNSNFRIKFSPEFEANFNEMVARVEKHEAKNKGKPGYDFERPYEMMTLVRKASLDLLGKDQLQRQVFIPAGRSFFTSIGKAVAAFEQGRVLDPLIIRFGRLYASSKDVRFGYADESSRAARKAFEELFASLLGGKLLVNGDIEIVECSDGRRIPLSTLSSGQQELLPLVTVLPHMLLKGLKQAIYIEEPEAHLFPAAQSRLIEILTAFMSLAGATDMVLTTHSPYVLVKINNLIKAGQLGRSNSPKKNDVANVVSRQSWIGAKAVNAYAIRDGVVDNIIDGDGMIDADYLDDISNELSREFMKLMEVEASA